MSDQETVRPMSQRGCGGKCPCVDCCCGATCGCTFVSGPGCDPCAKHMNMPIQLLNLPDDVDNATDLLRSSSPGQPVYTVGARVQARMEDDRLFYSAVVVTLPINGVMEVKFDHDTDPVGTPIQVNWVQLGDRREIYRVLAADQPHIVNVPVDDVIVSEGLLWFGDLNCHLDNSFHGARRALLLSFGGSPNVYQSGVISQKDGTLDYTHIFDNIQALALSLALVSPDINEACSDNPLKVVMIGGGGCTMPMAVRHRFGCAVKFEVVELHGAVVDVARRSFGVPTHSPDMVSICGDGIHFLTNLSADSRNVIVFDVCSASTVDGADLEFPDESFLDQELLTHGVLRPLKRGGVFALNIFGSSATIARVCVKIKELFGNVQVLATFGNYFFYAIKGGDDSSNLTSTQLADVANASAVGKIARDVIEYSVERTQYYRECGVLVGWLGADELLLRLKTEIA
eukprot:m.37929 g.37929  ORF g.37929 m.37929 type:complete len:457 (-) comp17790_c0_seq1:195-1565(-)